jgi:hypothetical protein
MQPETRVAEPSVGQLFSDLSQQLTTLVRQEVRLASTELSQKATRVGREIAMLAVGGLVVYAGFLAIVATAVLLLGQVAPWWLAAFIVGVVVAGIGYFLVQRSIRALQQTDLTPHQTVEALKEDIAWAKEQTR